MSPRPVVFLPATAVLAPLTKRYRHVLWRFAHRVRSFDAGNLRQRRFPADVKKAPLERYFFSNGSGDLIEPYRAIAAVLDWGRTGVSFDCARVELGENVGDVVGHLRRKQPVVREHLQCRYMRRPPHAVRLGPVPYDHAIRPPGGGHLSRRDRNHRLVEQTAAAALFMASRTAAATFFRNSTAPITASSRNSMRARTSSSAVTAPPRQARACGGPSLPVAG